MKMGILDLIEQEELKKKLNEPVPDGTQIEPDKLD
jgi:hypothetical protein